MAIEIIREQAFREQAFNISPTLKMVLGPRRTDPLVLSLASQTFTVIMGLYNKDYGTYVHSQWNPTTYSS